MLINAIFCFNPYSPGFSIYLVAKEVDSVTLSIASILIHLDFLSISTEWKIFFDGS